MGVGQLVDLWLILLLIARRTRVMFGTLLLIFTSPILIERKMLALLTLCVGGGGRREVSQIVMSASQRLHLCISGFETSYQIMQLLG